LKEFIRLFDIELIIGITQHAFGMDVQGYRQYKGLSRERNSRSMDALKSDVRDA